MSFGGAYAGMEGYVQQERKRLWEAGAAALLTVVLASILVLYLRQAYRERMSQELLAAAADGDPAGVKDRLGRGADPNVVQKSDRGGGKGYTPLSWTLSNGDARSLNWLLRYGADPNRPDGQGRIPLTWGHGDYVDEKTHLGMVRQLIAAGANVNARNAWGQTPLMNGGCPQVVRYLLAHGADVQARDDDGHSALKHARKRGARPETIRLLQQAGTPE